MVYDPEPECIYIFFLSLSCSPDSGQWPRTQLVAHGPGLVLAKHLLNPPESLSRRGSRGGSKGGVRKGGKGRGRGRGRGRGGEDSWKGGDSSDESGGGAKAGVVADVEWEHSTEQEAMVLMWNGTDIEGVQLPEPVPGKRPLRLRVSGAVGADSPVLSRWALWMMLYCRSEGGDASCVWDAWESVLFGAVPKGRSALGHLGRCG